jgi:hypothetical protein
MILWAFLEAYKALTNFEDHTSGYNKLAEPTITIIYEAKVKS